MTTTTNARESATVTISAEELAELRSRAMHWDGAQRERSKRIEREERLFEICDVEAHDGCYHARYPMGQTAVDWLNERAEVFGPMSRKTTANEYPFYFVSNREDRDGGPESTQEAAARAFEVAATEAYEDPRDWRPCTLTIEEGVDVYGGAISTELLYINTSDMSAEMFGDDGDNDNRLHWMIVEDGDPDIIEELHGECAPCSAIYYAARYAMAHYDKYGETFKPLLMY